MPPYVPTDKDQTMPQSSEKADDGKLRSQTVPSERPTISISIKRVESVRSVYGEPVFAAVSSLMPAVTGKPEESPIVDYHTEVNEVTEQTVSSGTVERLSDLSTIEPTLPNEDDSDRTSESPVFESTPTYDSQPEAFSANRNSNNSVTPTDEFKGRALDMLTADYIASLCIEDSPLPRRRSAAELLGVGSKSARACPTEIKRLSLKEPLAHRKNAYFNEVQSQKHTETLTIADTDNARGFLRTQYNYTGSIRKQMHSQIGSTSNDNLPNANSNHSTSKYSKFKLSLPNAEKRDSEFQSRDSISKPPKSSPSRRLSTFNPEGKHREDYEEIILSPRYDSRLLYDFQSQSCDSSPLEVSTYFSPRTTPVSRGKSLSAAEASQNFYSRNGDAHPKPSPRQHFRSYSAGDYIERSNFLDIIVEDSNATGPVSHQPKPLPRTRTPARLCSANSDDRMHDTPSSLNTLFTDQLRRERSLESTENTHFKLVDQDRSFRDTPNRYAVEFPLTNVTNSLYKFPQASLSEQITFENKINDFPPVS